MPTTLSPLRYPGGKTVLYDRITDVLLRNSMSGSTYIEPFAGGCGLALKLLFNGDVLDIVINDFDYAIYCIWNNILCHSEEYVSAIDGLDISIGEWEKQKDMYINKDSHTGFEIGVAALFLNRTNHAGVIKGGPIGGKLQNSKYRLDCRFNKKSIIEKIKLIADYSDRIKLFNLDVIDFIDEAVLRSSKNSFIYFDPPYIQKGPALYQNYFTKSDHAALSDKITSSLKEYKWVVTYDDAPLVDELYTGCNKEVFTLPYSAGNTKTGTEIMIYSNMLK